MYYFTSDLHFGDETTMKVENRPFKSVKQMNRILIKNLNKVLTKNDILYVIGDFLDCDDETKTSWSDVSDLPKKIKAPVILIMGNNEERIVKYFFNNDFEAFRKYCIENGFKDVKQDDYIKMNGKDFYLVHKPTQYKKNYINLFGHVHREGGIWKPFGLNVATDLNHFRPYSQDDIFTLLDKKATFWDNDKDLWIQ